MGYAVEAGIFSAAEVGAPHERERLFILAVEDTGCWNKWQSVNTSIMPVERNSKEKSANPIDRPNWNDDVGDTNGERQQQLQRRFTESGRWAKHDGEAMGDTEITKRELTGNTWTGRNGFANTDYELGNAIRPGQQQPEQQEPGRKKQLSAECAGANQSAHQHISTSANQFPAPPGHPQHQWEAPRVESSVGFTAYGYNFREDLLRLAGNGVVPQTAEKAFIHLAQKMKNII